jgi:AcrR family transcriptional regulator
MSLAKRISKDPEKRRSEFIEAAERLFTAKGYEETTVSDIVKEVNVAQGIFYSYSGSKGEVLEAMIEEDLAVLEDKVTGILERQESSEKKLSDVVNNIIGASAAKKDILSYLHEESNVVLHERLERRTITRLAPLLTEVLSEGSRKGAFDLQHSE